MLAMERAARGVVQRLRSSVMHEASEYVLRGLTRRCPQPARRLLQTATPQPRDYSAEDRRDALRHGHRWLLTPADHCQWVHYFGCPDPVFEVLMAFAERCRPKVALDIGANVGLYAIPLADRVAANGRVWAFEPHPRTCERLKRHVFLNGRGNITLVNAALDSTPGTARLTDYGEGDSGKWSLRSDRDKSASFHVRVDTLDRARESLNIGQVDLIKLDVEGFEPQVILGAQEVLAESRPIVFLELTPSWSDERESREALEILAQLGYRLLRVRDLYVGSVKHLEPSAAIGSRRQTNYVALPPTDSAWAIASAVSDAKRVARE